MTCECPNCNCAVTKDNDVEKDGKHYCCTACAEGHPNGSKGCCGADCACG